MTEHNGEHHGVKKRLTDPSTSHHHQVPSLLRWLTVISGLCRIKMLPVVGHVHGLRETLRVRTATANVALMLMKYTHAYIIYDTNMTCKEFSKNVFFYPSSTRPDK